MMNCVDLLVKSTGFYPVIYELNTFIWQNFFIFHLEFLLTHNTIAFFSTSFRSLCLFAVFQTGKNFRRPERIRNIKKM